jgi:hypothetical protein
MSRQRFALTLVAVAVACLVTSLASAMELDGFLADVNVTAQADLGQFRADLSATFHISSGEVDELFEVFGSPADVYISLRICDVAEVSIDRVVAQYREHKGAGWGVIAKNLGIRPGSAEFHALKDGRFASASHGKPAGHDKPGRTQRADKGKPGK